MDAPTTTCNRCRDILSFYRPDFSKVLGVTVDAKHIDEVIQRHVLKATNVWPLKSPRSGAQLIKAAYQCGADPDHHWVKNMIEDSGVRVAPIGG